MILTLIVGSFEDTPVSSLCTTILAKVPITVLLYEYFQGVMALASTDLPPPPKKTLPLVRYRKF